jgi:hypothetical protein
MDTHGVHEMRHERIELALIEPGPEADFVSDGDEMHGLFCHNPSMAN